jgi:hypothetical protein
MPKIFCPVHVLPKPLLLLASFTATNMPYTRITSVCCFRYSPADSRSDRADLRQRLDAAEHRLDDALAAQRKATDALKDLQAAG